ncbi:amino acid ABC transporter ATP-binding protein [Burkholderia cepacia]|uniref:amino acid ABC transporter ATP-binding protein n=1 Tax=Burkholderia cepacia TaxID=292 RepID=UPI000A6CA999|nr:amino acid ABC transporter ATP-binding protein [Burkholderia cepacia]
MKTLDTVVLKATALCKSFGGTTVLDGVNLAVRTGEVVVIMGASGSGKTTLIRSLDFLEMPDSGTVEICGIGVSCDPAAKGSLEKCRRADRRKMAAIRQNTAMVFQSFNLFPHMTALENVMEAPVHVKGVSHAEAKARGLELLARVGLSERADSYPRQLSGGQKQRVAIARGLAMDPHVIFFDEPTSALDPEVREEVLAVMRKLASEGMTMLIVTHEVKFARDVADRILFLEAGKILHDQSAREFFSESNGSERTRRFLGQVSN